jgi:hypothetical protein
MLAVQLPAVRLSSRRSCLLSEASIVVVARSFTVPMIFLFLVLFVDHLDGHGLFTRLGDRSIGATVVFVPQAELGES